MKLTLRALAVCVLLSNAIAVAKDEDHLTYGIPAGAKKVGPHSSRDLEKQEYLYFAPGTEASRENLVAIELVHHDGVLVSRELLKNGAKHGIQREWHPDGKPKLEAPYRDGNMEGTFKVWNERGDLIGQYSMTGGTGTAIVYDAAGRLVREDHYRNNRRDGLRMERLTEKISLTWSKDGHLVGKGCDFYESGELATLAFFSNDGQPHGPVVEFSSKGVVTKTSWYLNDRAVSETEYATAAPSDPSLPPHHADASQYKLLVGEDVRVLLEKYRMMPRVKIPLQFDQNGDPILAQQP